MMSNVIAMCRAHFSVQLPSQRLAIAKSFLKEFLNSESTVDLVNSKTCDNVLDE